MKKRKDKTQLNLAEATRLDNPIGARPLNGESIQTTESCIQNCLSFNLYVLPESTLGGIFK